MAGLVLGIAVGLIGNRLGARRAIGARNRRHFSIITDIFLRLIKMIIAPLVFSTLVAGIASLGDTKAVGRIAMKALRWFVSASLVSLLLGMFLADLLASGRKPRPAVAGGRRDDQPAERQL